MRGGNVQEERIAAKDKIQLLVDGKLPREDVKRLIRLTPKDKDRFRKYLDILQERVPWEDQILLRISDHLYIVAKDGGKRIVKCDCGHEFGDYRINWKLLARVYIRRNREEFAEVISIEETIPNPDIVEMREFYCPGCLALLSVEIVPTGYPAIFEMLPDLDAFYREWLGEPLEDERPEWFKDCTPSLVSTWAQEA